MDVKVTKEYLGEETEADLVEWNVEPGATVAEGDIIAQLETSKLVCEFKAPASGVVTFNVEIGDVVELDDVIATIE